MAAMPGMPSSGPQFKQWIVDYMVRIANIDAEDLQADALIREELGIDSLKAMEIVATLEKNLKISIDEGKLLEVKTVKDFFQLIEGIYNNS